MSHEYLAARLSHAAGVRAQHILPLTWFTLCVSIAVCVIIGAILWIAMRRRRVSPGVDIASVAIERGADGLSWIRVGVLLAAAPLAVTLVWTLIALRAVAGPPLNPELVLDVTAHQWWWGVHYSGAQPADDFETANEIHIPVGRPVLLRLHAADVIHSFWVPKLTGKTDVIPRTNQPKLDANRGARTLPWTVQRILRLPTRPHAVRSGGSNRRGLCSMARRTTSAGGAACDGSNGQGFGSGAISLRHVSCDSRHECRRCERPGPYAFDEPSDAWGRHLG